MGYLDKATITVDAILTNRGRELLAKGGINDDANSFKITKFAVADDEVNYGLYDTTFGNSTDWGYVIENMPVLEATPDEQQIMRYKLVTLPPNDAGIVIPKLQGADNVNITDGAGKIINISTIGPSGTVTQEQYVLIIADARLINVRTTVTGPNLYELSRINANGSITLSNLNAGELVFLRTTTVGGAVRTGTTTATIFGVNTGATATFTITVS